MNIIKKIGTAALCVTLTAVSMTSCKDSGFLDINYNPNYPSDASAKYLVAAAEASTVSIMGYQAAMQAICGVSTRHREIPPTSTMRFVHMLQPRQLPIRLLRPCGRTAMPTRWRI